MADSPGVSRGRKVQAVSGAGGKMTKGITGTGKPAGQGHSGVQGSRKGAGQGHSGVTGARSYSK